LAYVTGRNQHRDTVTLGLHGSTAACTAIAYGIEAAQHCVFKESMMYMTAFILSLKYLHCFVRIDPAGKMGVVLSDKAGKRLTNR